MPSLVCYSVMIKQSVKAYGAKLGIRIRGVSSSERLEMQVYPHGDFPVVRQIAEGRVIEKKRYSLVPRWSKVEKPRFATYNARVETIDEKPTWSNPILENRCLVAFNGFFESCYGGSHDGYLVRFYEPSDDLLVAAGVFENWLNKETGEVIESFAIITRSPSKLIEQAGHDRSPLFLSDDCWEHYLNGSEGTARDWKRFLLNSSQSPELNIEKVRQLKSKSK